MTGRPLVATRSQVLAFRRRNQHLDRRMPPGPHSLRMAASAGCKDSMPRAALLSLHARVESVDAATLDDPALTQIWGPGFHAYVVAEGDVGVFTLGRFPEAGPRRQRALEIAALLDDLLADEPMTYRAAGAALGVHHNALRYATTTGTITLHWAGSGPPEISKRPAPDIDPADARRELVRRFLRVLGPAGSDGFASWAGIRPGRAAEMFAEVEHELIPVRTPVGDAWLLATDEPGLSEPHEPPAPARLLPSGDVFYLLYGTDRDLLVPDASLRSKLWTPRVWPGALLLNGEVAGTWRRSGSRLTVTPWRALTAPERDTVEAEASILPLDAHPIDVIWD